ncbi:DUF7529 family protein [Halobacterium litoreum]|uniref:Uncharacterized protein n=1 Tax=Halobacterium litoreum TaxID=2039234 RepID=A0ABD5NFI2_9EURY|nr:hypothetical protein [Halobacterium litoreum]UHH13109.1 hypothetical protein LT972_13225 [Halobacterium litoreum]
MSENPANGAPDNVQAASGWQPVIEDMEATAEAYRDRGWTTVELHPGDSVFVDSEFRTGIDVVLPGSEYEELEAVAADAEFTDVDVFRAEDASMFYLLVVEKDPDSETAVFVPAYYNPGSAEEKIQTVQEAGELRLFCRRLNDDYVEFVHSDVGPFLPEGV